MKLINNTNLARLIHSTKLVFAVSLFYWSPQVNAFTCEVKSTGQVFFSDNGSLPAITADVLVDVQPEIDVGQNLVVDLSKEIFCINQAAKYGDETQVRIASGFASSLQSLNGNLVFYGLSYPVPLTAGTSFHKVGRRNQKVPWDAKFYITPISNTTSGILLNSGEHFLTVNLFKRLRGGRSDSFTWLIKTKNRVVIPTGTCDVSPRTINVAMGTYPIDNTEKDINLSLWCTKDRTVGFYLSGSTEPSTSIFSNISTQSPAQGIGIEILRSGNPISPNRTVNLGVVSKTPRNINLKARYALNGKPIKAGNVRSVINLNFVYN